MQQIRYLAALCGLLAFLPQALLAQDDYDRRWQVTVFGGIASLDNDRSGIDDTAVYGIGVGRFLTTNFSIDLEYDRIDTDTGNLGLGGPARADFEMDSLGFVGRYHLSNPNNKVRPYFMAGLGGTDHSGLLSSDTSIYITSGLGLRLELSDHFFGRVQIAYRRDFDDVPQPVRNKGFDDILATAGLTYAFGKRHRAPPRPAPVAASAPVAAPVSAPPVDGDDDGDGVRNSKDRCPDSRPGAVVGLDGCEVTERIDLPGVHFAFDSSRLTPESHSILDEAAEILKKHNALIVIVAGHTDHTGTDAYNQGLSERRANAVREYLIGRGIPGERMTARGYGESRPIASNDTREGRAQNRRVELVINGRD